MGLPRQGIHSLTPATRPAALGALRAPAPPPHTTQAVGRQPGSSAEGDASPASLMHSQGMEQAS